MAKSGKILLAVTIFGIFAVFCASAQEWTKTDLQIIYIEHLRNEGYVPSVDSDGDIQFKVSGDNYFIIIDDTDLQFFQIYTGFSIDLDSMEEALYAANEANRLSKIAKISVSSDESERVIISITIELILKDPRDFMPVFARALSLARNAETNFMARLK